MTPIQLKAVRTCDKLIGALLLRYLRPNARSGKTGPVPAESVRRILIIRPGGLGDAVLTIPMITALKRSYTHATVDVLAETRNADVYRIGDLIDQVFRYDVSPIGQFTRLRKNRYDLVVDTEQFHRLSRVVANAMRPKYLCGFDTTDRGKFLTHDVTYDDSRYEGHSFLQLAEALIGAPVPFDVDRPFVEVSPEVRDWACEQLESIRERKIVAIMPVVGGRYKLWPVERYAEIADWLTGSGHAVVLLGGSDGADPARVIEAKNRSGHLLDLAGRTSLAQTAGILERSDLSLSADTGIVHLAYGVGTPTVALFGSGLHRKWAPPGRHHRIVRKGLACSPCTRMGYTPPCPYDVACMQEISVADVKASIEDLLGKPRDCAEKVLTDEL